MHALATDERFCSTCQRSITDFTNATKQEFDEKIKTAHGRICGRFKKSQLSPHHMTKLAVAMAVVSAAACTPEPILAPSQKQFASGATQEEEFILGDIQLMQDAPFKEIDLTGEDSLSSNPDSLTNKSD